jgi:hypothetical protein
MLAKRMPQKGSLAVTTLLSNVRWVRVLLAGVATHVVNVVVPVVLIVGYSLLTIGPAGHPDTGSVNWFANMVSTWTLPLLTLLSAIWVARGARPRAAAWYGLLVGLLVAGSFGLLYFWPNDLPSLALFVLTIAAGFAGGVIGRI